MSVMRKQLNCCVLLILFLCVSVAQADFLEQLNEAGEYFTYENKPIHPGLVKEFASWISDPGQPTTITVDIAADHGNEYFDDAVTIENDNNVCLHDSPEPGYFCYKWLGKLDNGFHVLITKDSGGGTGVFTDLLFISFQSDEGYTADGARYPRLLMSVERIYPLGDRFAGEIKINGNRVKIDQKEIFF